MIALGLIFMYCTYSPRIVTEELGWGIGYFSAYFSFNGLLMFFVGNLLGKQFKKHGSRGVLRTGFSIAIIASMILLLGFVTPYMLILGMSLYTIGFIFIVSASYEMALSTLTSGVGKASGLITMLQMLVGAALSAVVGFLGNDAVIIAFVGMVLAMSIWGLLKTSQMVATEKPLEAS